MSSYYFIQVFITIALLGVFLFVLIKGSTYLQQKRYTGDIKILDRKPIDSNASLLIVKIKKEEYIVGVSGKDISIFEKL